MKITYLHQHFRPPSEPGGARSYEFARRLAAQGHSVTMICGAEQAREYELAGFKVCQLRTSYENQMSTGQRIRSFLRFMVQASYAASREKADVVLASSTPLTIVVPGYIAARAQGARFVVEVRDLWPEIPIALGALPTWLHAPSRWLERFAYGAADSVIALSPGMAEGVLTVSPDTDVTVIPNCSDRVPVPSDEDRWDLRRSFQIDASTPCIYYAGSLGRIYDARWIASLAVALQGRAQVKVVGAGAGLAGAQEVCRKGGIDPDDVFLGPVPRSRAMELSIAGDIALSSVIDEPTLRAASINKIFDAFGTGRPVLTNHSGWLSDLIQERGAGWQIDRDLSTPAAARTIGEMLDPSTVEAASAASRGVAITFDRNALFELFRATLLADS